MSCLWLCGRSLTVLDICFQMNKTILHKFAPLAYQCLWWRPEKIHVTKTHLQWNQGTVAIVWVLKSVPIIWCNPCSYTEWYRDKDTTERICSPRCSTHVPYYNINGNWTIGGPLLLHWLHVKAPMKPCQANNRVQHIRKSERSKRLQKHW